MNKQFILAMIFIGMSIGSLLGVIIFPTSAAIPNILILQSIITIIIVYMWYQYFNKIYNLPLTKTIKDMGALVNADLKNKVPIDNQINVGFQKGVEFIYYELGKKH